MMWAPCARYSFHRAHCCKITRSSIRGFPEKAEGREAKNEETEGFVPLVEAKLEGEIAHPDHQVAKRDLAKENEADNPVKQDRH